MSGILNDSEELAMRVKYHRYLAARGTDPIEFEDFVKAFREPLARESETKMAQRMTAFRDASGGVQWV